MTDDDVRRTLRGEVKKYGTQRALAAAIGVSQAYLNDVLLARRPLSDRILQFLGLAREVVIYPKKKAS